MDLIAGRINTDIVKILSVVNGVSSDVAVSTVEELVVDVGVTELVVDVVVVVSDDVVVSDAEVVTGGSAFIIAVYHKFAVV